MDVLPLNSLFWSPPTAVHRNLTHQIWRFLVYIFLGSNQLFSKLLQRYNSNQSSRPQRVDNFHKLWVYCNNERSTHTEVLSCSSGSGRTPYRLVMKVLLLYTVSCQFFLCVPIFPYGTPFPQVWIILFLLSLSVVLPRIWSHICLGILVETVRHSWWSPTEVSLPQV